MKVTEELIEKIKLAEQSGMSEEIIIKMLDLKESPSKVKEEFYKYSDFVTVSEASKQLKDVLGKLKNEKAYELKVLRLIDRGEIAAEKPSNRDGYRIHKEEVSRFIEDSQKSKDDWRKAVLHHKKMKDEWEKEALHHKKMKDEWEKEALHHKKMKDEWEKEALYYKQLYEELLATQAPLEQEEKRKIRVNTKPRSKKKTGVLEKNKVDGRYYVKGTGMYFTSGGTIEFMKGKKYVSSTVEHGGESKDYYIVELGKDVPLEGIKVRY